MYLVSITSCLHMSAFSISCWTLSTKNHGSGTVMYQPMPQALPYVILLCKRQAPSTLWLPICDGSDMLCKCFEEAVCHLLDPVKWHVHFMYLITVLLKFALKKCLSNIYNKHCLHGIHREQCEYESYGNGIGHRGGNRTKFILTPIHLPISSAIESSIMCPIGFFHLSYSCKNTGPF